MYRTVDSGFWTDAKIKALSHQARLLFLYLITNPHTHVSGIYYLPPVLIPTETGLTARQAREAVNALRGAGMVEYDLDAGVVWVRQMLRYQGRGDKNERAAARHIYSLRCDRIVKMFLDAYPNVQVHVDASIYDRLCHTLSDTLSDRASETRTPVQDQDQDQEQNPPLPPAGGCVRGFQEAWDRYPHHHSRRKKAKAREVWKARKLERQTETVLAWIDYQRRTEDWTRDDGQYVPAMEVWLKGPDFTEPPPISQVSTRPKPFVNRLREDAQ